MPSLRSTPKPVWRGGAGPSGCVLRAAAQEHRPGLILGIGPADPPFSQPQEHHHHRQAKIHTHRHRDTYIYRHTQSHAYTRKHTDTVGIFQTNPHKLLEIKPFNIYIEPPSPKIRLLFKVRKPGVLFLFFFFLNKGKRQAHSTRQPGVGVVK